MKKSPNRLNAENKGVVTEDALDAGYNRLVEREGMRIAVAESLRGALDDIYVGSHSHNSHKLLAGSGRFRIASGGRYTKYGHKFPKDELASLNTDDIKEALDYWLGKPRDLKNSQIVPRSGLAYFNIDDFDGYDAGDGEVIEISLSRIDPMPTGERTRRRVLDILERVSELDVEFLGGDGDLERTTHVKWQRSLKRGDFVSPQLLDSAYYPRGADFQVLSSRRDVGASMRDLGLVPLFDYLRERLREVAEQTRDESSKLSPEENSVGGTAQDPGWRLGPMGI